LGHCRRNPSSGASDVLGAAIAPEIRNLAFSIVAPLNRSQVSATPLAQTCDTLALLDNAAASTPLARKLAKQFRLRLYLIDSM